jgi:branched-chain amino acid transport system permease protein
MTVQSPSALGATRRPFTTPILLVLGLAVIVGAAELAGGSLDAIVTETLIYVVIVVGLQVFVGNTGIISFGHVAFMLVAAYATTWQTCCIGLKSLYMPGLPPALLEGSVPLLPAAFLASLLAAAFALIVGLPLMRLSGIAAGIALFGVLAALKSVYQNWNSWTAGTSSIIGLPIYVNVVVAFGAAAFAIFAAFLFQRSRHGVMLRAAREDEVAARSVGINVFSLRVAANVLSGFLVGIGGVLYVHYLGMVSVDIFWLDMTFVTLAMLVVGGMRSLSGAVVGVVVVRAVTELLRRAEDGFHVDGLSLSLPAGTQAVALAIVLLAILIFRPDGLLGDYELSWPFSEHANWPHAHSRKISAQSDAGIASVTQAES